ncbi:alkaline phosphatase family protein [Natronomonas salsuginis]|uniref:Nucleotide pyrophosphatase n=1 Tax=Natronomonas salsuginis TaxID=2217661 RepID=A0A4V6XUM5_9EURY|nr:alkaline phosphatase family protein [Natronomonas salsuginis]TKR25463.1 nucleotide pyrophosphatase [Natronomonas salsuginis]
MGKTVVIGLDAFHTDLLEFTPYIESLYNENLSGELESTQPPVTAPAWASFQTGKNQGKHGVYDFITFNEDFDPEFLDGTALRTKPFYESLDEHGFDCCLFNLPFSLPARIEGDIVPSWLDADDRPPVPRDLYDTYGIKPPEYPTLKGNPLECIRKLKDSFEHNRDQFLKVLRADDHDFLFQLVSETDWLQHQAYLDLVRHPEKKTAEKARELLRVVDEYVRTLDSTLDDDDTLLLMSDHGFQVFDRQFYINDWLEANGYLEFGETHIGSKNEIGGSINIGGLGRFLFQQEWLHPVLRPIRNFATSSLDIDVSFEAGIDTEQSSAYCRSKDEAAIRLSPAVAETEKKRLIDNLVCDLQDVSGVRAYRREDVYEGKFTDEAGEIILASETCKIWRGPVGQIWRESLKDHHSSNGMFVAVGVPSSDDGPIAASLLDIAPTLLIKYEIPIPIDTDGEILPEYPTEEPEFISVDEYTPQFVSDEVSSYDGVQRRLEDLGYL